MFTPTLLSGSRKFHVPDKKLKAAGSPLFTEN